MNDYYDNDSGWQVGEKVLAFDHIAWMKNGGDSDQDDFMRPAVIVRIEAEDLSDKAEWYQQIFRPRILASVQWEKTGKVSHGRFLYGLRRKHE